MDYNIGAIANGSVPVHGNPRRTTNGHATSMSMPMNAYDAARERGDVRDGKEELRGPNASMTNIINKSCILEAR